MRKMFKSVDWRVEIHLLTESSHPLCSRHSTQKKSICSTTQGSIQPTDSHPFTHFFFSLSPSELKIDPSSHSGRSGLKISIVWPRVMVGHISFLPRQMAVDDNLNLSLVIRKRFYIYFFPVGFVLWKKTVVYSFYCINKWWLIFLCLNILKCLWYCACSIFWRIFNLQIFYLL